MPRLEDYDHAMSTSNELPKFSDLPLDKNGPHHNAWGLYGPHDELGTLNRLTDDVVRAASAEVQTGVRINLDWPLNAQADIPFFGRQGFEMSIQQKGDRIVNDDVWVFNTQSSSQWDGFRHFGYQKDAVFYNGLKLEEIHGRDGVQKTNRNGVGAWADRGGIVGRGILLDYHSWRVKRGLEHDAFRTVSISAETLQQVAADQGTEIRFGDILFIRSGYMDAYKQLSRDEIEAHREQPPSFAGVETSEKTLEFLWNHFSAAAADHPSFEAWPPPPESLHEVMLGGWGMPIGELFDLEKLAEQCEQARRWSFFLVSKPVNVPGGVASPPNAVAIF